jgi:hypothetical protein
VGMTSQGRVTGEVPAQAGRHGSSAASIDLPWQSQVHPSAAGLEYF